MYRILRPLLFLLDAETAHHRSMEGMRLLCGSAALRGMFRKAFTFSHPGLEREVFGLRFPNPIGLAAGFDKNAAYLRELALLGFGSVEIGTVTPRPQPGNERPRLFRLPADGALINRMGFNNEGAEAVARRLSRWRERTSRTGEGGSLVIGGNIGRNKSTANEDAWKDYAECFKSLHALVDYFVVNVSSPNTPGLRALQDRDALEKILSELRSIDAGMPVHRPLLLKIAPDLEEAQLDEVASLAVELGLDGIVATNTTVARQPLSPASSRKAARIGAGGLSGRPLRARATEVVRGLRARTDGRMAVVASGGVFSAMDAREKLEAGAALVQVWTGFVYEGPGTASRICKGLV